MSNKDKLIEKIHNRLRELEGNSFVIILGQKEWADINSVDNISHIDIPSHAILGHKFKVLPLPSTIDIVSEETFKVMMEMQKRELVDGLSRLNTLMAHLG